MNSKILLAAMGAVMIGAAQAGTCYWSGAADGCWTNAANWVDGVVPGQYYGTDGVKAGSVGDTAVFDSARLSGNAVTTISFDGVYSVSNILTTGSTRFTYGTKSDQMIPIEPFGTFSAAETATTPAATVACRLQVGVDCPCKNWASDNVYVRNNSSEEFVIGDWGYTTKSGSSGASETILQLGGTGAIRLTKAFTKSTSKSAGDVRLRLTLKGTLTVDAMQTLRSLIISKSDTPLSIVLNEGAGLKPTGLYGFTTIERATTISGDGTFCFGYGMRTDNGVSVPTVNTEEVNAPLTLKCRVASHCCSSANVPDDFTLRAQIKSKNASCVTFAGTSELKGTVRFSAWNDAVNDVCAADTFGNRGTYGSFGDVDLIVERCVLRHVGATADTTDRAISVTNNSADVAGYLRLDQAGAGAFTVNSAITLADGATATSVELDGDATAADATFGGTIGEGLDLVVKSQNTWTFNPASAYSGKLTLNARTFVVGGKNATFTSVKSAAANQRLVVAAGGEVTIKAFDVSASNSLNIDLADDTATVKLGEAVAAVPAGLTINRRPAKIENGVLKADDAAGVVWKSATDGAWTAASNWTDGAAPDGTKPVFVVAPGADYAVTREAQSGDTLTLTNLVVDNAGAGTATVKFKNGAVMVKSCTATSSGADAPSLTIGKGGAVTLEDATLKFHDLGKDDGSGKTTTGKSPLLLEGGALTFSGASKLAKSENDVSGTKLVFGTGKTTFKGTSQFCWTRSVAIQPTRAGETAEVEFTDAAYISFDSTPWSLDIAGNKGVVRLTIDTTHAGAMSRCYNATQVGKGWGVGEFILKGGSYQTADWDNFFVGSPDENDETYGYTCQTTGRVEIAKGAKLSVTAGRSVNKNLHGVQIGHGTAMTNDDASKSLCYGEMRIDGTYEQKKGVFLVASGPCAKADVFHSGAAFVVTNASERVGIDGNAGGEQLANTVGIGVFGGIGRYVMTDGTFDTSANVYVGGVLTNDLRRWHANGATFDKHHDAQGALTVSGGTFATAGSMILGRDGTGVLTLSGSGTVKANELVVSNTVGQAASEIRFVVGADGTCGKIDAATKLKFEPGAHVVVDVSAVSAENPKSVVLWNLDEAPEGLDNVTFEIVGNGAIKRENALRRENGDRRLAWRVSCGLMLILR